MIVLCTNKIQSKLTPVKKFAILTKLLSSVWEELAETSEVVDPPDGL